MKPSHVSVLIVLVAALAIAGCGGPSTPPPPPPQTPAGAAPGAPAQQTATPLTPGQRLQEHSNTVTIYRDTWGVPHIYSDTERGAAYGLGYATAEDRLADIHANVRIALGTAAEVFGPSAVETDMAMQLVRNAETCQQAWAGTPIYLQTLAVAFMDGVKKYSSEHPEKTPEWAVALQPWHCMAIGRAMIMRWPLGTVFDDLDNRKKKPAMGSNEWSVAPARSADKCAILLTDPHLAWEGMSIFYEARVHGGKLHMNGFFMVGSPLLGFGHSEYVGWAPTTGGPDTSDVFTVKVDLTNKLAPKYELNGEWKTATPRMMTVNVKGQDPVTKPTADTELGPMVDLDEAAGVAYIGASPYFGPSRLFEQTYKMLFARNAREFYDVIAMNEFMEQNLMYADREGNIGYLRAGKTPIRPDGFDWNAPVPATPESMWKGMHPIADLVQILNPEQGYMQNCNISPANMMLDSPMTPDKYPSYIYNVSWDVTNPRGKRITALLSADESVTREEAMAYAQDVYDILAQPWQAALKGAVDAAGAEYMKDEAFAKVVNNILAWDGQFLPENTATPIYKNWRMACSGKVDVTAIAEGTALAPEQQTALLDILKGSIAEFQTQYGSVDVPWGEIYRVGRGDKWFGAPGADFGGSTDGPNMTETLFDVRSKEDPAAPGKYFANNGSMATMLMFFRPDGIESLTCTPWGQSADPESPHYADQAEQLYSKRQLKPTWFKKDELMANKASEKVLTLP